MLLKTELKAIQDKKNVIDHAVFEHIVNTISQILNTMLRQARQHSFTMVFTILYLLFRYTKKIIRL